jgi:membrane associated rhomboid family serine protease
MKQYPATMLLLSSIVLAFGVELAVGAVGNDSRLLLLGAIPDSGAMGAEYWRLLSYAWLHAGYAHLAVNGALLWWVGRIVEGRTGSVPMLGIYLGCALAGGLLMMWKTATYPKPGTSVGASAAIFGLVSCALVLFNRPGSSLLVHALRVKVGLWVVLLCGLAISFLPGISLVGHVGGLIMGACFGLLVPVRRIDARTASVVRSTDAV